MYGDLVIKLEPCHARCLRGINEGMGGEFVLQAFEVEDVVDEARATGEVGWRGRNNSGWRESELFKINFRGGFDGLDRLSRHRFGLGRFSHGRFSHGRFGHGRFGLHRLGVNRFSFGRILAGGRAEEWDIGARW